MLGKHAHRTPFRPAGAGPGLLAGPDPSRRPRGCTCADGLGRDSGSYRQRSSAAIGGGGHSGHERGCAAGQPRPLSMPKSTPAEGAGRDFGSGSGGLPERCVLPPSAACPATAANRARLGRGLSDAADRERGICQPRSNLGRCMALYPFRPESLMDLLRPNLRHRERRGPLRDNALHCVVPGANAGWRRFASGDCQ
jgi:hypothetical protein